MTDDTWISQMTWQDWIDRAALREQCMARALATGGTRKLADPLFTQTFETVFAVRWQAEFAERLAQRKAQAV